MPIFQATSLAPPAHQVGALHLDGRAFRPRVTRVVWNRTIPRAPGGHPRRPLTQHAHAVYHVFLIHRGEARFLLKSREWSVGGRSLFCISPGEPHHVLIRGTACTHSTITFDLVTHPAGTPLVLPAPDLLGALLGTPLVAPESWPVLPCGSAYDTLEQDVRAVYEGARKGPACAAAALTHFLVHLAEAGFVEDRSPAGASDATDARIQACRRYIQGHYADTLSLDALAERFSLSRRSLTRDFRAAFHVSPIAFQIELRMGAAQLMLHTTNLQIQEVAAEVGYADVFQFSRAFTQRMGVSPRGFRERAQWNAPP